MTSGLAGRPAAGDSALDGAGMRDSAQHTLSSSNAGLVEQIRTRVIERLAGHARQRERAGTPLSAEERDRLVDELIAAVLADHTRAQIDAGHRGLDTQASTQVAAAVRAAVLGLGPFEALLRDPTIENINANGADTVWIRRRGGSAEQAAPVASSDEELIAWVRHTVAHAGGEERRFDRGAPGVSAQLPDGSRLFAVMAVGKRVYVSLRRFGYTDQTLTSLQRTGTLDAGLRAFLTAAVRARLNILIAGGPAVGKTTFLRALAAEIGQTERLITIEDAFELNLDTCHGDVVALQARQANTEGVGEVPLAELVRWALRMSPDRVIVGEVRGAETVPMLNAMSQGCDGSMATLHASSSAQAFLKLAAYAVQSAERLPLESTGLLIASAVHLVVHLDYAADDASADGSAAGTRTRVVSSIREVVGSDGPQVVSNEIYRPGPDKRARPAPGAASAALCQRLAAAGLDPRVLASPLGWWQP